MQRHIVFFGLICHVGDENTKRYAALVADREHVPLIIRENGAFVQLNGMTRVLLNGQPVHTPASSIDNGFDQHVPHLDRVTNGRIRPDVLGGTSPLAAAYFAYPGGDLQTHSLHYDIAQFDLPPGHRQSVAKTTVLTFDDGNQNVAIDYGGDEPLRLGEEESCVLVANMFQWEDESSHFPGRHKHFHKHRPLTTGSRIANLTPVGRSNDTPTNPNVCAWVNDFIRRLENASEQDENHQSDAERTMRGSRWSQLIQRLFAAVDIECSQSQWP